MFPRIQVFWDVMHCNWERGSVPNIMRDCIACIFKGQALECLAPEGEGIEMLVNIEGRSQLITSKKM